MTPAQRAFATLIAESERARSAMSNRERIAFAAGLRAAHAEEALTAGEAARAMAHFTALEKLVRLLENSKAL